MIQTAYIYLGGKQIAEAVVGGATQYVHTDALGSPVAHTSNTGVVLNRTKYEPYGFTTSGTKPGPTISGQTTTGSAIGFTGHVNDPGTDLVYMQQRYYDPVAGRFLSVDPVVTDANTGGSFNRYAYANNSPYKYIDPDGLDPETPKVELRSPEWMRATVPGQVAWDTARTAFANGEMRTAALGTAAMVGEAVVAVVSGGSSKAVGVIAGQGGRFSSLTGVVGDGLTAHHIPQAALGFTSRTEGGAVVMTTAEHEATRTFSFKGAVTKAEDAGKSFRDVLAKDVKDVRSIVGSKYNEGLKEVTKYYKENFPELMKK